MVLVDAPGCAEWLRLCTIQGAWGSRGKRMFLQPPDRAPGELLMKVRKAGTIAMAIVCHELHPCRSSPGRSTAP